MQARKHVQLRRWLRIVQENIVIQRRIVRKARQSWPQYHLIQASRLLAVKMRRALVSKKWQLWDANVTNLTQDPSV